MSRLREPPRLVQWTKRGQTDWYIFYTDYTSGTPKRKRVLCEALGAVNAEQRRDKLNAFKDKEVFERADALKQGGVLAFDSPLLAEIKNYRDDVTQRGKTRETNPESRQGLSSQSVRAISDALDHFETWLKRPGQKALATGHLDRQTLQKYFDHLATTPGLRGKTKIQRSAATLNHHRRIVRACLRWINSLRPRRFPDFEELAMAFKPVGGGHRVAKAYSPQQLIDFAEAALAIDRGERRVEIERTKAKFGNAEAFEMGIYQRPATPIAQLFLLLVLTGCRRQEALDLKWSNVDFERKGITIYAQKTGRERFVPLAGAAEGEVAPKFLQLLKVWSSKTEREYVLPHNDIPAPTFAKSAWADACQRAGVQISPQRLRQNFTSYGASMGVSASTCALWQGHSTVIAERHYRAPVPSRKKAPTFEKAMGLDTLISELTAEAKAAHEGG